MNNYEMLLLFMPMFFILILALHMARSISKTDRDLKYSCPVSFIVPVWNEERTISQTIEALLKLAKDYPPGIEVIIVNNRSTDNTAKIIKQYSLKNKHIRLVNERQKQGKSHAFNKGVRYAKNDIIACVDADSYPTIEAVTDMVKHFSNPKVGAITSKMVVQNPTKAVEWLQYMEYIVSNVYLSAFDYLKSVYISRGPLSMYRKKAFEEIGGFLHMDSTPTEDMEITFRLRKAGYLVRSSRKGKVYTTVMPTWKKLYNQRIRWNRGTFINFWLHKNMLFRPGFRTFGLFTMPFLILSQVFMLSGLVYMVYRYVHWGFDIHPMSPFLLNISITGFVLLFIVNVAAFVESEERLSFKKFLLIPVAGIFYGIFLMVFWVVALTSHILRLQLRWR